MTFSTDLFLEYKKRPGKPALARLLERHQDAVYTLCRQVLRHSQDAEDACQEVLLEVARQVDRIAEPERFGGWLYRTALHTAMDVKRKRGRQRARDAGARPPGEAASPESAEALHQGLAGLDDRSRELVVEHYFARRPLRELAAERGCSEVAVWKRIQSARERLKSALGSAALSALEGITLVQAPAGVMKQALLRGGWTMAVSGGIKLAIAAPLVLLAGAGVVMTARRPEPAPQVAPAKTAAPRRTLDPAGTGGAAASTTKKTTAQAPALVPTTPSAPRRPYPLKLPGAAARSQAAEHTWSILSTKRVTIDEQNVPIPKILEQISRESGIAFHVDPAIGADESLSFKVQDIVLDGALRLMLMPREKGYEIRPDGTVAIAPTERLSSEYQQAQKVATALQELGAVREKLDGGWDGLRDPADLPRPSDDVRTKRIAVPQGETTLLKELLRLREEHQIYVHVQFSSSEVGGSGEEPPLMNERFLQVVEEHTVGDHLEQLARRFGLTVVDLGNSFWMTTLDSAQTFRSGEEERQRGYQKSLEVLKKPLPEIGTVFVQDLLDSIPGNLGVELLTDKASWESGASVTLRIGATLRDALDAIKAQGFRWALNQGKIFVLK